MHCEKLGDDVVGKPMSPDPWPLVGMELVVVNQLHASTAALRWGHDAAVRFGETVSTRSPVSRHTTLMFEPLHNQ